MYYVITFDLIDPDTNDYDPIYKKIKNYFLGACHILSTTCVIKSNKTVTEIQDWILEYVTDTEIRFFVSEYNPQKKGYYLSENVVKCVDQN